MTAEELYKKLDDAGIPFEIQEIFEGLRVIAFEVEEQDND